MIPIALTMKGFGSFLHEQTFEFPQKPGLYFMTGRNEAEPSLERNGAGKSTVWRALTWCLFGKDARGLSAGNVANWQAPKGASVRFEFEADAGVRVIERTHAPNSWTITDHNGGAIDLTKDTTNEAYAVLRLSFDTWLSTVLMAQDEPMFLDLKASAKAELFANVMGLDRWDGYSKTASTKLIEQSGVVAKLQEEAASIEGELRGRDAIDVTKIVLDWETGRTKDLAAIESEYTDWLQRREQSAADVLACEKEVEVCRAELAARDAALQATEPIVDNLVKEARERGQHWAVCDGQYRTAKKLQESLVAGEVCLACGAPSTVAAIDMARLRLKEATTKAQDARDGADDADERLEKARERESDARNRATKALQALRDADARLSSSKSATARIEARLDELEDQAEFLTKKENPHARNQKAAARDRERLGREHGKVLRRLDEESDRGARLGIWVRAFKDIRLELIGEALGQLEAECAGELAKLGLPGWELVFEIDRETASGTVARGFNVLVRGPLNSKQVPWEAWSGGEAQRLRVAAQGGLANLIRSSTGASIALEVWDEPSHGMSAQGVSDLLRALRDRAQAEQRVIFVVDHHALASGAFDGTITIVKTSDGSHVEQE